MARSKTPILIVCAVSLVIFVCLFDRSLLENIILSLLADLLSTNVVTTSIAAGSLSLFGGPALLLTGVKLQGASVLASALIDVLKIQCVATSLLSSPRCHFSGELYQGHVTGEVAYTDRDNVKGSGEVMDLSLSQHPLLRGYGFENGSISLTDLIFEKISALNKQDLHFSGKVLLKNVDKPMATKLSPSSSGLPFPIEIPPFSITELKTNLVRSNEFLLVEHLTMDSSLGKVEADGTLKIEGTTLKMDSFTATLNQNEMGRRTLLPYLQFVCAKEVLASPTITLMMKGSAFTCRR